MGIPFPCSGEKKGNSVKKFCFALLPFDDCVVISRARKLDRNMDMRRMNSLIYLKRARQAAERGDLECCISSYVKGFYLRCTASGFFDIEFSSFFDYQCSQASSTTSSGCISRVDATSRSPFAKATRSVL